MSLGQSDRPTVDAPLPSGGEVEVRRLRDLLEASLFDRERDGVRIGRFTILDRLGEGGMGVVYAAYDPGLDRKVAIKVLRREGDPRARQQLVEEARALARLSHPSIVTVHEVGEHGGQVFLAMEHVAGEGLDRWIRPDAEGALRPWRDVLRVFDAAGRGLAAAHAAGLVHRDFKPHNVMLGDDGAVKVLDFGLARAMPSSPGSAAVSLTGVHGSGSAPSTVTGGIAGTPAYMSPEQIAGERATDRSDQFSFCVALHEALFGQRPYPGRSLEQIAFAMLDGERRPLPTSSPVPGYVRAAIDRGLSSDAEARFDSMHDLLAALRRDRSSRRRRLGGSVVLGGAALAGALAWPGQEASDPCASAGSDIADAWGAEPRAAARDGLLASGNPRAAATWTRVEHRLDAYADDWRASAEQACRDHAEGRDSPLAFDRRTACLRSGRASLSAVAALFAEADGDIVDRAWASASGLPELVTCDGDVTDAPAAPSDPTLAALVDEQRNLLAGARVLEQAGRFTRAERAAAQALASANELGFMALVAEAEVVLGSVAMAVRPPEQADAALGQALSTAVEAGHDRVALEAVAKRAFVRAELARRPETARDDQQLATALLARHGATDDQLGWLVHNNLGVVRERDGDLPGAEHSHRRALEHARRRGEAGHVDAVASLTNLAFVVQRRGDAEEAVRLADEAVTLAENVLGSEHPLLPSPLVALAEAHRAMGDDRAAIAPLERALAIHERVDEHGLRPDAIGPLATLAEVVAGQGERERATVLASRAHDLADRVLGQDHPLSLEVRELQRALLDLKQ